MNIKTLNVFYGEDFLPYKDNAREVHYPNVGSDFQGANEISEIHFYTDRIGDTGSTTFAVAIELPNGKIGSKVIAQHEYDEELHENYVVLPIDDFITKYVGNVTISLRGYQGDITLEYDSESELYVLSGGTPITAVTGGIKLRVNQVPQGLQGEIDEEVTLQQLLGLVANKLNIEDAIVILGDISTANLSGYDNGQLFYDKTTDAYYRKKATSPYYELANNGKGVLGASRLLCRLTENNATIERALSICGSSMFVYNPNGKDYLYFVTEQVSGSTAVAFDIETRRTFIRSGMQDSDTLASVINITYEADLDLNDVYVKTKGVKIGDIYHTIELISGDMVIGSGSGDILLQPNDLALYETQTEDDFYNRSGNEIANVDFVKDNHLTLTEEYGILGEEEYSYLLNANASIVYQGKVFKHSHEDSDNIYYKCADEKLETNNLENYDTYTMSTEIAVMKEVGNHKYGIKAYDFHFFETRQAQNKFATNFTASLNTTTYVLTFTLKNAYGNTLATQTIDLPLESIVTSMTYYDEYTYGGTTYHNVLVIVLATTSVPTIVPVGSLISGLEHEALVEVSDISTPLTASQLALMEYQNAMIKYGNNVYLKAEDNGTYITLSVPYISLTTNSGHEEATRKFIVVTKSSGAMSLTSDITSFYNKSQTDTLLGEKADASSVVTDSDIETLGGAVTRIRKGNTWNEVAQEVDMSTTPKVVQSVADLPADNDGYLYVVLDNGYLYSWDEENQEWAQRYQYTSDLLTITQVEVGGDDYSYIEDKTNDNRPIQVDSASKDGNGDVIDETYAKISDLETIDERLDNHDTDIAKLKKDVDYAMKYPLLYGTPTTDTEEEVGLTTSQLPATALPKGLINYVGGMSQKVNQLVRMRNSVTSWGITFTKNVDGSLSMVGSYDGSVAYDQVPLCEEYVLLIANHKYLVAKNKRIANEWGLSGFTAVNGNTNAYLHEYTSDFGSVAMLKLTQNEQVDIQSLYVWLVDLTSIYGAGNEPTTTSDARIKWLIHYLTDNPQYDEGSIVNAPVEKLSSKGFNFWDEEWELRAGTYLTNKNHIKVTPNAQYFFHIGFYSTQQQVLRVMALDDEYNFIDYVGNAMNQSGWGYPNTAITMPPNASYIDFELYSDYGTTYNHDICINLSGSMNGTYLPYQAPSEYPIPAEVKALDGYGLGIDDTLYNYIDFENKKFVKKVGIVDLGTLNWQYSTINGVPAFNAYLPYSKGSGAGICSKYALQDGYQTTDKTFMLSRGDDLAIWLIDSDYTDANTLTASLSGTHLVYDIATTTETDISEYLDRDFPNENLIDTYQGGEVEFENDNDMGVPYSLTYQYKVE